MIVQSIQRLEYLCEHIPPLISAIPDNDFSNKQSPEKWSRKEILGHLIDSASNNHQRFVRVQFEETPFISYDQNKWNIHSYYNSIDGKQLITFWTSYNAHLASVLKRIPAENYKRTCRVGEENTVTLEFLINDYVDHLEHHLKQIVNYE